MRVLIFCLYCFAVSYAAAQPATCLVRVLVLGTGHASPQLRPQIDSLAALNTNHALQAPKLFAVHATWLGQCLPVLYQDIVRGAVKIYHPDSISRKRSAAALQLALTRISGTQTDLAVSFTRYASTAFELHYRYSKTKKAVTQKLLGIVLYAIDPTNDARNTSLLYLPARSLRRYRVAPAGQRLSQHLAAPRGVHYVLGYSMGRGQPLTHLALSLNQALLMEHWLATGQWQRLPTLAHTPADLQKAAVYCTQSWQ